MKNTFHILFAAALALLMACSANPENIRPDETDSSEQPVTEEPQGEPAGAVEDRDIDSIPEQDKTVDIGLEGDKSGGRITVEGAADESVTPESLYEEEEESEEQPLPEGDSEEVEEVEEVEDTEETEEPVGTEIQLSPGR